MLHTERNVAGSLHPLLGPQLCQTVSELISIVTDRTHLTAEIRRLLASTSGAMSA